VECWEDKDGEEGSRYENIYHFRPYVLSWDFALPVSFFFHPTCP